MAFHHVAIATRDLDATHRFYTEAMGFDLVKVVAAPSPEGGWAKHVFYDTGQGGLIAFWDLHGDQVPEFDASISRALGLPAWTNHLAFDAPTLDALAEQRRRWQDFGLHVAEIDHGWCTSIYVNDPNDILVEFCTTTQPFTDADRAEAARLLADTSPELEAAPEATFHAPTVAAAAN
jgi:catechol 2,3-dioxygenase-like lactoylglutathione lyase family enzyme